MEEKVRAHLRQLELALVSASPKSDTYWIIHGMMVALQLTLIILEEREGTGSDVR